MVVAKIFQNVRDIQLIERWHVPGYVTKHGANPGYLAKDIDSKPAAFLRDVGEVEVLAGFEPLALLPIAVPAILFGIGLYIALSKRNAIAVLMGVELMLNSVNLTLVAFSRFSSILR